MKEVHISDTITMHLADCLELLPGFEDGTFTLALVDPPYGSLSDAVNKKDARKQRARRTRRLVDWNDPPPAEYFTELDRVSRDQIVWGGNYFGRRGGVLVWNKRGTAFGEAEVAICSTHASVRIFEYTWNGMMQEDMQNKEQRIHPTQKPVALYKWCLAKYARPGSRIIDTHGGSGSLVIACHDMGYPLTWIEKDPDTFARACDRVARHVEQGQLFSPSEQYGTSLQQLTIQ